MTLKEQLEFYFSNENYFKDTFLRTTCEENKGIPIQTILTFKKLRSHDYTEDDIRNAIADSKIVKVDGDKLIKIMDDSYEEYITRNHSDYMIVIEGLDRNLSLEDIKQHFSEYFQPKLIRMIKNSKKKFIGTVMVELESVEEVKRVVQLHIPTIIKSQSVVDDETSEKDKTDIESGTEVDQKITKCSIETVNDELSDNKIGSDKTKQNTNEKESTSRQHQSSKRKASVEKHKSKKIKSVEFLTILTQTEYFKLNKNKKNNPDRQQSFFEENRNRFYRLETSKDLSIKEIKEMNTGISFVDLKNGVVRFKEAPSEDIIEVNEILKFSRLDDDASKEYVKKIGLGNKKPRKK